MENYFYRKLVFAKSKSSGTSNYADLSNKPQINGVELVGNKTSEDLGIEQGVTEEVLTQALAAESAAREKQDELLQGEIEGKIAAANILAGNGINVSQEGNNVTINSTVQPKTYTAGTNIEITEDDTINNTIPFVRGTEAITEPLKGIAIGGRQDIAKNTPSGSLVISSFSTEFPNQGGFTNGKNNVVLGHVASSANSKSNNVVVGYSANAYDANNIVIGSEASTNLNHTGAIVLGRSAESEKSNQFVLGSTVAPINEMKVVTSDGDKYIATTDQTVPTGGTKGQVLMKNSDADYDFSWTSLADYDEVSF